MKATYRNVVRSKTAIKNAVIKLLGVKKGIGSISITDIVNEANINRGTFYNHYSSVDDVINEIEDELTEEMMNVLQESMDKENTTENFIGTVSNYLVENEDKFKILVQYMPKQAYDELKEKFINLVIKNHFKDTVITDDIRVQMYILGNGLVGTYCDYMMGRINLSLNEIAQYSIASLQDLMNKVVHSLKK